MASEDDDIGGDGEEAEFESQPRLSKKKLIIIGAAAAVVLIGGGITAYMLLKKAPPPPEAAAGGEGHAAAPAPVAAAPTDTTVFYDLPEILVNIDTGSRKRTFLKLTVSVELGNELDIAKVEAVLPKIVDNFQIYLRDLKPSQLEGAAGAFRIREELLVRINAAVRPVQVNDVLLKQMLLQ